MRERYLALSLAAMVLACIRPGYAAGPDEAGTANETAVVTEPSPEEWSDAPSREPTLAPTTAFAVGFPLRKPAWYFQVDALAIRRDVSSDRPFAALGQTEWTETANPDYVEPPEEGEDTRTEPEKHKYMWDGTATLTTALTLDDTSMNRFQGGGRILLGRTLGRASAFEVSYFDMADWRGTAIVRDATPFIAAANEYGDAGGELQPLMTLPGSLFSPLSHFGSWIDPITFPSEIPFDGNNLTEIRYSSSLNNLEWNLRHWVVRVPGYFQASLLLGGRYMNVDETFYYHTERGVVFPAEGYTVGEASTRVTTDTSNPMIGAQIGGTYEICVTPGWWLDCELKGALLSNGARQETLFVHEGQDDYQGTHLERADRSGIASALDATFTTRFSVSPHVAVHFSYQLLYMSGLALASDNFSDDPDVLFSGPASVVADGNVLYHGLHLGLTGVW